MVTTGDRPGNAVTCLAAWLVPGAGHVLQGSVGKAMVFAVTLLPMYAIGLYLGGRLFTFADGEPLVWLAGAAQWMQAGPRLLASLLGAGAGDVVAVSYEYGNSFLIVAGLLNMLVVLDAFDVAQGRK